MLPYLLWTPVQQPDLAALQKHSSWTPVQQPDLTALQKHSSWENSHRNGTVTELGGAPTLAWPPWQWKAHFHWPERGLLHPFHICIHHMEPILARGRGHDLWPPCSWDFLVAASSRYWSYNVFSQAPALFHHPLCVSFSRWKSCVTQPNVFLPFSPTINTDTVVMWTMWAETMKRLFQMMINRIFDNEVGLW